MKVRFLKSHTTRVGNPFTGRRDPGAPEPETFNEGDVVDFYERHVSDEQLKADVGEENLEGAARVRARASAMKYVNRGLAEIVEDDRAKDERRKRGVTPAPKKAEGKEGEGAADAGGPQAETPTREARGEKGGARDYDEMTAAELHEEATSRELEGRSGLDKAGLVKALQKDDAAKAKEAAPARRGPQAK